MGATAFMRRTLSKLSARLFTVLMAVGDRFTPKRPLVAFRTYPDFDAQGTEVLFAMSRSGATEMVWLSDDGVAPQDWPAGVPVLHARSWRGICALWRARVVVHTHGVYGGYRPSRSKRFVNVWHGMPIKRLMSDSAVGRHQSSVTIATSELHAAHLAETWGLRSDQVRCTGLPRNDVLMRSARSNCSEAEKELWGDKPLVVWLPTYRRSAVGDIRSDGQDAGNVFQLADADLSTVDAMARRLGLHVVVKVHPMAERQEVADLPNLSVWDELSLRDRFESLYELLGRANILVTDYSSVWVDFLLLVRPVIFAIGDSRQYADTRGFYEPLDPTSLPGPVVDTVAGLEAALMDALAGSDAQARTRLHEARSLHHVHLDACAALRVAELVVEEIGRC